MKPPLLIIGATSKIAERFIDVQKDHYTLYATHRSELDKHADITYIPLDLLDVNQVKAVSAKLQGIAFVGVLVFASTYTEDKEGVTDYIEAVERDVKINALSPIALLRSLSYESGAKVIFFGDSGVSVPKRGYTGYSISKILLPSVAKLLAVELADRAQVITFKLGPTLSPHDRANKPEYYARNLISVDEPVAGLIRYCEFLLHEKNLNITGTEIDYDGGAYIKR